MRGRILAASAAAAIVAAQSRPVLERPDRDAPPPPRKGGSTVQRTCFKAPSSRNPRVFAAFCGGHGAPLSNRPAKVTCKICRQRAGIAQELS